MRKSKNKNFNLKAFARKYYYVEKKENGYAVGHLDQKKALGNRGYLMSIIFDRNDIWITPNEIFYMTANAVEIRGRTFYTQNGMKCMGNYTLNVNDQKELCSILPNFQLKIFHKWMIVKVSAQNYQNELIFYSYNYYGSFGQIGYSVMSFESVSPVTKKYKEWFGTKEPIHKKIPKPLKYCGELFDKDVLEIKQLVKDIGDLNTLIHREQKNFVLHDDSNIISNTFLTELNKNIQSYGIISL